MLTVIADTRPKFSFAASYPWEKPQQSREKAFLKPDGEPRQSPSKGQIELWQNCPMLSGRIYWGLWIVTHFKPDRHAIRYDNIRSPLPLDDGPQTATRSQFKRLLMCSFPTVMVKYFIESSLWTSIINALRL